MSASNLTIEQTLGDFIQNLPPSQEYLILSGLLPVFTHYSTKLF